ncbi:hypothetical protein [Candidatus Nitrosotenuis uzonensis]|uniref:Uncharacterized protein n=1 Tax=Candidatus Nitrosotenuis uzonensis TaxID=1407055 RepID=V6AT97_9ARCH|nr:hypothetical protein [Candidatus Nitrosotenuis uzonensis]CDI05745.1 exported hypothetical protein [Candidatus Nitrosotenuis uzonensis]
MNATNTKNFKIILAMLTLVTIVTLSTSTDAFGHASFTFVPGAGTPTVSANHTVSFVIGETFEPAFVDGYHDLEVTMTHIISNIRLSNAHKDQTSAAYAASDFSPVGKVLRVDTYFYPTSTLVAATTNASSTTGGIKHAFGGTNPGSSTAGFWCPVGTKSSGILTGNAFNCIPNAGGAFGYVDSRTGMFLRPLGASEQSGSGLQYRQNTRQYYTESGLTLYHIYGQINYFNDTGIGKTNINMWIDGKNIKTLSLSGGNNAGGAAGTNNRTHTVNSGFGLSPTMDGVYWPDSTAGVTDTTHPSNVRKAIGTIRQDNWDIFNFLRDIATAINSITGGATGTPVNPIPAAKP